LRQSDSLRHHPADRRRISPTFSAKARGGNDNDNASQPAGI